MNGMLSLILEGLTAPRQSARRLLDGGHGLSTGLLMLILGYLVLAMIHVVMLPDTPGRSGGPLARHVWGLIFQIAVFFLVAGMIFVVGRFFGGVGALAQSQMLFGWHSLVSCILAPAYIPFISSFAVFQAQISDAARDAAEAGTPLDPQSLPPMEISGGAMTMGLIAIAVSVWLLANYVAELHKFRNVWGVMAVICGMPIAIGVVLMFFAAIVSAGVVEP
jgi:hypothetical protein